MTEPLPADDLGRTPVLAAIQDRRREDGAPSGGAYKVLIAGNQTQGRYCLIELVVPPGGGPPLHRHDFEEMFLLLDGEIEFTVRGVPQLVSAPHALNVPANAPHRFANRSSKPAHLLCMCAPAGLEEYFELLGKRMEAERLGSTDPAAVELLEISGRELALRYGMELIER